MVRIATAGPAWRLALLGLLAVALVGPWAYDTVFVPAEYSCSAPFIRLDGDFCGTPLSGFSILAFMGGVLISSIFTLFTGAGDISGAFRELLFGLSGVLILLPFISTLLLFRSGGSREAKIILIVSWGLGAGLALWLGMSGGNKSIWALWGIWLYCVLAVSAVIVEGIALLREKRLQSGEKPV